MSTNYDNIDKFQLIDEMSINKLHEYIYTCICLLLKTNYATINKKQNYTSVFDEMHSKNFVTTKGDEFIISIAAYKMKNVIKNAGAYIFRFWTGSFYLVSTYYTCNEVAILHLPSEKVRQLI